MTFPVVELLTALVAGQHTSPQTGFGGQQVVFAGTPGGNVPMNADDRVQVVHEAQPTFLSPMVVPQTPHAWGKPSRPQVPKCILQGCHRDVYVDNGEPTRFCSQDHRK